MSRLPLLLVLLLPRFVHAADPTYLDFIKKQAADLRSQDQPPATLEESKKRNEELRKNLLASWGGFPEVPCPLDPQSHGTLQRDGYRVEKITFQTRPGIRMTANIYLPDKKGKLPAILQVHGHWKGAKQDPVVQSRCIGATKLGYVVLCVDAFGAGERGVGTALGEYHGEMTAATLFPTGLPLSGLQVYENMRAVDYLLTRPEVDKDRLGITGASGGGNQTMYAGAFDELFKAVVPVCSVGNYQAYLGAACCMCEVVPGALKFTEEGSILGLVAPRGLMVVSATRDAFQFSVGEAKKSVAYADSIFKLHSQAAAPKHAIFDSPHDYSKAMREEMYGWMAMHLKGEGDGSPIKESEFKTENPEDLRCYPGNTRPKDWVTLPQFAAAEGKRLLAAKKVPASADEWAKESEKLRTILVEKSLGGFPKVAAGGSKAVFGADGFRFSPEPGIELRGKLDGPEPAKRLAIVLSLDGADVARSVPVVPGAVPAPLAAGLAKDGWSVATFDLRATGQLSLPTDRVGRAPDHNTAEWGLWIGRPLLGQWVFDVRRFLDFYEETHQRLPAEVVLVGEGGAGLVALCAAATDKRVTKVVALGTLVSYVSESPYIQQRLGVMAPGILRDVGDVAHVAALVAPRRVVIAGGMTPEGRSLFAEQIREAYRPAAAVWEVTNAAKELVIQEKTDAAAVIAALK